MMMRSDKISSQFLVALSHLEKAEATLHAIKELDNSQHDNISDRFAQLTEFVEEIHMDICMPMQMSEEETLDRIQKMEQELFDLRASLR